MPFGDTNGVSFALSAGSVVGSVFTGYVNTSQSSGFAGAGYTSTTQGGSTVGVTQNSGGLSVAWPPFITTAAGGGGGAFSASGGSSTFNTLTFSNQANGVTFSNSAGQLALSHSLQQLSNTSAITASAINTSQSSRFAGTGYSSTTQAGSTVGVTQNTSGLSMAWPPFLTTFVNDLTSGRAGTGFTSTTTAGTAVTASLGTNGLSMAVPAYLTTFVNDLTSGRAGTGFTSTTTAGTAITAALGTNGLSMAVPNYLTTYIAQTTQTQPAGNIAGVGTTLSLTNLNGTINVGTNGVALSLSAGVAGTVNQTGPNIGVSNLGSTAGTTGTVSSGNVVFVGSNGILLSQSIGVGGTNATISINNQPLSAWANNLYQFNTQTIQPRQSTSQVFPAFMNNPVSFDHIRFPMTVSIGSTTVATTANTTFSLGVFYTVNAGFFTSGGTNATSLVSALTTSAGLTHQISVQVGTAGTQYSVTHALTYPFNTAGGTSSFSASYAASTSNLALSTTQLTAFTGMKHFEIAMSSSLPANAYWIMYGVSSATSTAGIAGLSAAVLIHSNWAMSQPNNTWGFFGQANNASVQALTGVGSFSTAGGGTVSAFGFSNISSQSSHLVPYIYMEFDG
jgi:hypothetical protein